jgi:hypothetical protein
MCSMVTTPIWHRYPTFRFTYLWCDRATLGDSAMSHNVFGDTAQQKFINPAGARGRMWRRTICVQLPSSGILESWSLRKEMKVRSECYWIWDLKA